MLIRSGGPRQSRMGRLIVVALFIIAAGPALVALAQPANDACANAIPIANGVTPFSNVDANTDGPSHAGICLFDGQAYHDIWYEYTAPCTGELRISTCNTADYDSDIVVYDGCDCGSLTANLLGCNDDGIGCTLYTSDLRVPVVAGNCYLIRVGGHSSTSQGEGEGTIELTCLDPLITPGACCHDGVTCTQELQTDCESTGGLFKGMVLGCTPNPCTQSIGPDVTYSDFPNVNNWGIVGNIRAYSMASDACNIGTEDLPWDSTSPLLATNAYRIFDGRIEQIGMAWVKNGVSASAAPGCGPCNNHGGGVLGAGCKDSYTSNFNGTQGILGPRSTVNAFTGAYPGPSGTVVNLLSKRLQIATTDMSTINFPGARFLLEGQYVAGADIIAKNQYNNASYMLVTISGASFNIAPINPIRTYKSAIFAWRDDGLGTGVPDPDVSIVTADVPGEGRFFIGSKATSLGGGLWRYDYAIQNYNSHRSAGSFFVPLPGSASKQNLGFHDVNYHSGEPYDNTDWNSSVSAEGITWSSPQTFAENPNSNALRWGTLYNFHFETDVAPTTGEITLGLFRPGSPADITAIVTIPTPEPEPVCKADCSLDGERDGEDVAGFTDCVVNPAGDCACADMDDSGGADLNDVQEFVNQILDGSACPEP